MKTFKIVSSKLPLFLILFCATSLARANKPSCNDLLSGLSVELKLSIQNLAQLRFDLDRRAATGVNDFTSRTLLADFERKQAEILRVSGLTQDQFLSFLRNEVQKVQAQEQIATAKKIETKNKESEQLDRAVIRIDRFGDLHEARYDHVQSVLADNKVLIVGGYREDGDPASVELIDPTTKKIEKIGDLHEPRVSHAQSVLVGGKVLVAGGLGKNGVISSIELIDPLTKKIKKFGNLHEGRYHHTQSVLADGKVLVVGGYGKNGSVSSIELIDPVTKKIEKIGDLHEARYNHTQSVLADGKVLVVGGRNQDGFLSSIELIDPVTKKVEKIGDLHEARDYHTESLLSDGKILVVGGHIKKGVLSSIELIDPVAKTVEKIGDLHQARFKHTQSLLPNGKVLILGGRRAINEDGYLFSLELIDPVAKTVVNLVELDGVERRSHSASTLADGSVLIVGGESDDRALSLIELIQVGRK